jgi:hypothetical protein
MQSKLTRYLYRKQKKIALIRQCFLLCFKNILLIRTIKLKSVTLYDSVVIEGNEVEIYWRVKGCHKIEINGIGVFPGNIHGLRFLFLNAHNPIEITFFGIAKQLKRQIQINSAKVNLLDKFILTTELPGAIEVPFNRNNYKCEIIKYNLKLETLNISVEFEPFNLKNYKPINID